MRNIKSIRRSAVFFFAVLIVAMGCGFVGAQDNSYAHMLNVTMTASQNLFIAQTAVNKQREIMRVAAGQSPYGSTPSQTPAHVVQYPINATDFQPLSPPIMPDQFADAANGVTPEVKQQMRLFFQQVLTAFGNGARKNNMANAFAFICAASMKVKNGKEPSSAEVDQMIGYFNNTLAASPQYYTFNPRQQQMLYESLIITGGIIMFLDTQARQTGNQQMQAQARQMSAMVLKAFLNVQ